MKKILFLSMLAALAGFTSCSKSDEAPNLPQSDEQSVTFQIEAPAATRATVTGLTRYIVEAYENKDLTTTPVRVEAATGSLTLALKKNTEYTFVFWADKGEANANTGYWDAAKLQEVKVVAGKENTAGEAAYCLAVSFNSKDFETNKAVTLKNATAQINFVEAAGLTAAGNSLVVKYSSGGKLNVATGVITEVAGEVSRTHSNIAQTSKDGIVATDYILAPFGEKCLLDLKVTFNTEAEKSITAIPFQQSYKTNVKGEYSNMYASTFTISNEVDNYEKNPDVELSKKANVGDFYMKDGTWISSDKTLTAEQKANCIGIVFYVNANGTSGKIVGLTEKKDTQWSTEKVQIAATSLTDGRVNIAAIAKYIDDNGKSWDDYPAFKWVAQQNGHTTGGWNAATDKWYLPAKEELKTLYGNYTDGTDNSLDYGVTKIMVMTSLNNISGAQQLTTNWYWSSTAYTDSGAWLIYYLQGGAGTDDRPTTGTARVIAAF